MISEYHLSYYCVKSLYWKEDMCIFILYDDTRIVGVHSTKQSVGIIVGGVCPQHHQNIGSRKSEYRAGKQKGNKA